MSAFQPELLHSDVLNTTKVLLQEAVDVAEMTTKLHED